MVTFIVGGIFGLLFGVVLGGYIVKNNKDKAFKALDKLKAEAEEELVIAKEAAKKEIDALRKEIINGKN